MNLFKDFKGFGCGELIGHWKEEPSQVAIKALNDYLRGKEVRLEYENRIEGRTKVHSDRITVPSTGSLDHLLSNGNMDNIKICTKDDGTYEVQRIVIGDQWTTELSYHKFWFGF